MSDVSSSSAHLTDHFVTQLVLIPEVRKKIWKFIADRLNDEDCGNAIKDLMLKIKNDMTVTSCSSRWKNFTFEGVFVTV